MKAVMKHAREFGGVDIFDIDQPAVPNGDEVLVKIHSAALCGSDIHAYEWIDSYHIMQVPVVLGHEGAGIVEAVGENVTAFKVGDRVMGESNIYCGSCRNCRLGMTHICADNRIRGFAYPGVMQEYVIWLEKYLHRIPETLSFAEGAASQAVTISVHGVLSRINVRPGDGVLISGVGIIGLSAAQLARACGAKIIMTGTDADEESRIPMARRMGFEIFNCQQEDVAEGFVRRAGHKADITIECSGAAPAFISGLAATRKGGAMLLLGIPNKEIAFPFANAIRSEINIVTSYTSNWDDYEKSLDLLASGVLNIKPLLSSYPVEKALQAFKDAINKTALKPVLQFTAE
jgi:L-iditol 2-dehydrogenase